MSSTDYAYSSFDRNSLANLPAQSSLMWMHLVSVYVVTFIVIKVGGWVGGLWLVVGGWWLAFGLMPGFRLRHHLYCCQGGWAGRWVGGGQFLVVKLSHLVTLS